mmetsp:Transcript_20495/g.33259  ORF Transcript_20495/g.33259 Transcript_20495/m.33259 type:complete len:249 (+) Transcript_20495:328-1074(+)
MRGVPQRLPILRIRMAGAVQIPPREHRNRPRLDRLEDAVALRIMPRGGEREDAVEEHLYVIVGVERVTPLVIQFPFRHASVDGELARGAIFFDGRREFLPGTIGPLGEDSIESELALGGWHDEELGALEVRHLLERFPGIQPRAQGEVSALGLAFAGVIQTCVECVADSGAHLVIGDHGFALGIVALELVDVALHVFDDVARHGQTRLLLQCRPVFDIAIEVALGVLSDNVLDFPRAIALEDVRLKDA